MLYPIHPTLGSVANLDKTRIPEYNKGIQVVNNWIKDFFFDVAAVPSQTELLTVTIQRACLALEFQPSAARDIFKRSPWLTDLPAGSPKRDGEALVLHDFIDALSGTQPTSIISGMLGMRYRRSVFCNLVQRMTRFLGICAILPIR